MFIIKSFIVLYKMSSQTNNLNKLKIKKAPNVWFKTVEECDRLQAKWKLNTIQWHPMHVVKPQQ